MGADMEPATDPLRYRQVADHIRAQMGHGLLRPGDRLPSVRRLAATLRMSVSTVVQGYALLQDERVIESRPQSGFYVRELRAHPPPPAMSRPVARPTAVSISQLAVQVVQASDRPGVIQMGTALPRTDFPAVRRLHAQLATLARRPDPRLSSYDIPPGYAGLRQQIARRAVDAGLMIDPDELVITTGCQEALLLSLRTVARAGDTVVVESPTFYGTLQAIESLGLKALEIPTDPRTGISLEALQLALEQWRVAACLLTPSFSNPLGSCMDDQRKQALVQMLEEAGVPLIEDDIYADLYFDGTRPRAAKAWDRSGNVLLCSSLSKTLDPGLRIGWVAAGRHREAVTHLKLVSSMASATLPARAAAAYLEGPGHDRHLQLVRRLYREQRDRLLEQVARQLPGSRITCPPGGLVAWLELPAGVDAMTLYSESMASGLSIAPGPLFSATGRYRRFIRLNYAAVDHEGLVRALAILGRLAARSGV